MNAGDLVLTDRDAPLSRLIRWGQRFGRPAEYCWATHAAIAVSDTEVVEALGHGVVRSPLSKYADVPYRIVSCGDLQDPSRDRVVAFALHAVGRRYGYAEIASLGAYLLTGTKWRLMRDNQLVCSALAAEALSRIFIFPFEPLFAMPADLAAFFNVGAP